MKTFPTKATGLSRGESPSLYGTDWVENTLRAPVDGGYEFRRKKFTRDRKTFQTGYISANHGDYLLLKEFFESHKYEIEFLWYDYMHDEVRTVRFDEFKPDSMSVGKNRMWTVKIKMSEV